MKTIRKPEGFVIFSGGIEIQHWAEIGLKSSLKTTILNCYKSVNPVKKSNKLIIFTIVAVSVFWKLVNAWFIPCERCSRKYTTETRI